MFMSSYKIMQTRELALNNLHGISLACLDARRRMSELFSARSRAGLKSHSRQMEVINGVGFDSLADTIRLMSNDKTESSQFVEQYFQILSDTHKAMIEAAEAQVRIFDEVILANISRVSKFSPRETEVAFDAMRTTLEDAERTLHNMGNAAIQTVDLAGQEIHQLTDSFSDSGQKPIRAASKSRKKAEE
jgi:hypothetical protein